MEPRKQRLSSMLKQQKMENPMGAGKKQALRVTFDSRLKLEFHGSKVTSDTGLLAYRELDEALGLTGLGDELLNDWRTGKNTQHSMVALIRQSLFSRLEAEGFEYAIRLPGDSGRNGAAETASRGNRMKEK
jgi:hypothetical protein